MRGFYYTGLLIVVLLCHSQKFEKMLLSSDSDGRVVFMYCKYLCLFVFQKGTGKV